MFNPPLQRVQLPPIPFFLLALALAIISGGFFMGSLTNPHGQKHDESHDIRKCLENGGARKVMFMESMNRWAFMCQLEGGKWGFRSVGYDTASHEWYQATSFSDDSFTTQSILEKYLTGRGYSPTGNVMGVSASPSQLYAMLLQAGVVP